MSADLQQQPEAPAVTEQPDKAAEQPSADAPDAAQSETTADAKPPEGEEGDKKARRHLSSIQKRIDELTRERHDERRAREAAEARMQEMEQHLRGVQTAAEEPKLEKFESITEYSKAVARWEAQRLVSEGLDRFAKENLQSFQQREHHERAAHAAQQFDRALGAVETEGKKAYPDFEEVVSKGPHLGPNVGHLVLQTERPHDISYYLAKNPEHAMSIAGMSPVLAMREIAKLEAQFVNKRITSAPTPPKTIGSASKGSTGLSDDLPPAEWYAKRQAQLNRKS